MTPKASRVIPDAVTNLTLIFFICQGYGGEPNPADSGRGAGLTQKQPIIHTHIYTWAI